MSKSPIWLLWISSSTGYENLIFIEKKNPPADDSIYFPQTNANSLSPCWKYKQKVSRHKVVICAPPHKRDVAKLRAPSHTENNTNKLFAFLSKLLPLRLMKKHRTKQNKSPDMCCIALPLLLLWFTETNYDNCLTLLNYRLKSIFSVYATCSLYN